MDKLGVKTFFFAIGDYSRFSILAALIEKDMGVNEIANAIELEQSNVSHHLTCLLNCGFVNVRRDGKMRIYSLKDEVKPMVGSIMKHIQKYNSKIIACNIADKEYISRVIK